MRDDFGQGEVRRFDVKVALDNLQIRRNGTEEVVCFPVGDVAET